MRGANTYFNGASKLTPMLSQLLNVPSRRRSSGCPFVVRRWYAACAAPMAPDRVGSWQAAKSAKAHGRRQAMDLTGIHHLTAISGQIQDNHRFYTDVLGMRLVKRSVNQDDVRAYHLFYADAKGSPGTDLTFFDWSMPRERRGGRSIARTSLRVAGAGALDWWADRLRGRGVAVGDVGVRDGRLTLDFEDPEGQRLALVDDGGAGEAWPWDRSPVP